MKTPTRKKKKVEQKPEIVLRRFMFKASVEGMEVIFPILSENVDAALEAALSLCQFREWIYIGRVSRIVSAYERAEAEFHTARF